MDTGPKDDQTAEQGEEKLWEQLEVNISFRNHYSYLLLKELKKDDQKIFFSGTGIGHRWAWLEEGRVNGRGGNAAREKRSETQVGAVIGMENAGSSGNQIVQTFYGILPGMLEVPQMSSAGCTGTLLPEMGGRRRKGWSRISRPFSDRGKSISEL